MRYLRKFNEAIGDNKDLLLDFETLTNDCLAYLIDAGFTPELQLTAIETSRNSWVNKTFDVEFTLFKEGVGLFANVPVIKPYKWEDIKDDFIPFLELVKQRFIIHNEYGKIIYIQTTDGNYTLSIKDILDDNVGHVADSDIKSIKFIIKGHK